jgi:hypothetical protein
VNAAAALIEIRGYAAANRIRISRHAWQRMAERGAQYEDVRYALSTAKRCKAQEGDRGRYRGPIAMQTSSSSSSPSRLASS